VHWLLEMQAVSVSNCGVMPKARHQTFKCHLNLVPNQPHSPNALRKAAQNIRTKNAANNTLK